MIGKSVLRVEDQRFLIGSGRYIEDLSFPDELHCAIVRSPHPHARIRAVRVPAGVLALTGEDMARDGVGPMRCGWALPGMVEPPRYALARGTVRHVGEPVAAVFAESRAAAEDAAELVELDYEALPLIGDEKAFTWQRGDRAAVDAAFARAPRRVRLELMNNRLCGAAIETRGAIATGDTLYCGTQAPHHIRRYVCEELGIAEDELRVVSRDMGGGFGYKGKHYPEETLVVWASRRLKRPVKWIARRTESFLSDTQGRDHLTRAELALDDEGHFLAVRVQTRADLGAYVSSFGAAIPGPIYSALLAGVYRTPAVFRGSDRRLQQHGAYRRLSRRGASGGLLCARTARRSGGARARHRSRGDPPAQPHSAERDAVPDAGRADL